MRARAGVAWARVCVVRARDGVAFARAGRAEAARLRERRALAGTCTTTKPERAAPWNQPAPPPGFDPEVPKKCPLIDMYT